jgi:hypothetical protein
MTGGAWLRLLAAFAAVAGAAVAWVLVALLLAGRI